MLKNNKSFKLLLCVFVFSYYSFSQEYFEGEVYYKIDYESFIKNLPKEALAKEMGDTLVGYIQENKYAMTFNTKGELGANKTIVLLAEGYSYMDFAKSDTIYKSKLDKEPGSLLKFRHNPEDKKSILGDLCESITINYEATPGSFYKTRNAKYYFNTKYTLNPNMYKNHKENFWHLFVGESKSITVRNEVEYLSLFKSTQQAYKIVKKKIPDDFFKIDKTKFIKELK